MFLSNRLMHLRYLLLVAVCVAVPALSQNICRISHREGFSNCSILSLAQDADGYVWAGSCDGLNLWDGHYARNFRLSGNNSGKRQFHTQIAAPFIQIENSPA